MKDRNMRVYRARRNNKYPSIILQGKWLHDVGYSAGDYIKVTEEEGRIIISIKEKYLPEEEKVKKKRVK